MDAIATTERKDAWSIDLVGKLYAGDAAAIRELFKKAMDGGAKHILLDCARLDQVDSTVLSTLIAGLKLIKAGPGGKIVFVGASEHVVRLLTLTKMNQFFPIAKDRAAALALLDA
jgi:anti-sigma B factor antagonist